MSPFDALKRRGMFNCNCHGSTYTKAGLVVKGPATRTMDTMAIELAMMGSLSIWVRSCAGRRTIQAGR